MSDSEQGLVTDEGVDEGSSASATESGAGHNDAGVLGTPGVGTPANDEQDAEPDPVGPDEPVGPGQRLEVGEG